eukprot:837381-Amphidinium_carterae.1
MPNVANFGTFYNEQGDADQCMDTEDIQDEPSAVAQEVNEVDGIKRQQRTAKRRSNPRQRHPR